MATLSPDQAAFLKRHGVPLAEVFDASGMRTGDWKKKMKLQRKTIAIGANPCRARGHTIRTRGGHCAQCDPTNIVYTRRHERSAYVYIAGSKDGGILKIGFSEDPHQRIDTLNNQKYGLGSNWELLLYVHCDRAGAIESEARKKLSKYIVPTIYDKGSKEQFTLEQVRCSFTLARDAIAATVDAEIWESRWERSDAATRFHFDQE